MAMPRLELPVNEMAARYEAGENTHELACAYGVSQMTVWNRLHAADVKMRPSSGSFGNAYGRGNKGKHKRGGPLHVNGKGYLATYGRDGKACLIHRARWEAHWGAIPLGHDIHHRNESRLDNRISNLNCLLHGEHTRLHLLDKSYRGVR